MHAKNLISVPSIHKLGNIGAWSTFYWRGQLVSMRHLYSARMKQIASSPTEQMEFGLSREESARFAARREPRAKRDQLWFGQTPHAVNPPIPWSSEPPARPEPSH